jgi:hypothetical protein
MNQSLHQYVLSELQAWKGRWPSVASKSQVSLRTIQKIASGEIQDPGVSHIEKLAKFFRENSSKAA